MSDRAILTMILVFAASVWITRFLPFLVFKNSEKLPPVIEYLGRVLPAAMMGLLVVYCFKDYDFTAFREIFPALLSAAAVLLLQLLRRNMILSISLGTALYMVLIRVL